jgi:hypothetical protein
MKKLRLSLDALAVETFETYPALTLPVGTVRAREEDTDASNCKTCDTCVGPNCRDCGCLDSTAA